MDRACRKICKCNKQINPDYLALLTLLVQRGTELYEKVKLEKFKLLTPREILMETKFLIKKLDVQNCIFRSNHASNYISLSGTLPNDKEKLLTDIDEALKIEFSHMDEFFRRL